MTDDDTLLARIAYSSYNLEAIGHDDWLANIPEEQRDAWQSVVNAVRIAIEDRAGSVDSVPGWNNDGW